MIGLAVGLDLEAGEALARHLLAPLRVGALEPDEFGGGTVAHQPLAGREGIAGRGPSAGTHRRHDTLAQPKRGHDEAKRQSRRHFLRKTVEQDAGFRRQRR